MFPIRGQLALHNKLAFDQRICANRLFRLRHENILVRKLCGIQSRNKILVWMLEFESIMEILVEWNALLFYFTYPVVQKKISYAIDRQYDVRVMAIRDNTAESVFSAPRWAPRGGRAATRAE